MVGQSQDTSKEENTVVSSKKKRKLKTFSKILPPPPNLLNVLDPLRLYIILLFCFYLFYFFSYILTDHCPGGTLKKLLENRKILPESETSQVRTKNIFFEFFVIRDEGFFCHNLLFFFLTTKKTSRKFYRK